MKPVINIEETIGKVVGRRTAPRDSFKYAMGLQRTAGQLGRTFGNSICPKGVYRFKSHEEADAWMLKMITRRPETPGS
jgi:hypothetical protein